MSAADFVQCWKAYVQQLPVEHNALYDSNTDWTNLVLGHGFEAEINKSFGRFLVEKIPELCYRTEDGKVDLSFYSADNFRNVVSLNELETDRGDVTMGKFPYPKSYRILFEHENDILCCWEEMIKLTYFQARLKVLVTYNWNEEAIKKWEYVNDVIAKNFQTIIQQANENFKENPATEYLLIIGQKMLDGIIGWRYFAYANHGENKTELT